MKFLFVLISLGIPLIILANGDDKTIGAEQAAMAYTGISAYNVYAIHNNIACSAFLDKSSIGISYRNNHLLPSLNNFHAAFTLQKQKIGAFSLGLNYFGIAAFNTTSIDLGYARKFGNKISTGLSLSYHHLAIQENGHKNLISVNLGLVYIPVEKIRIAFYLQNPIKQKIAKPTKESLRTAASIGLAYFPAKQLKLCLEFEKDLKYPVQARLGVAYKIHKILEARIGASVNPTLFSWGIGLALKQLQIDLASTWDVNIGLSPQISLQYAFGKN